MHDCSAKFKIGLAFTAQDSTSLNNSIIRWPADTMLIRRNRTFCGRVTGRMPDSVNIAVRYNYFGFAGLKSVDVLTIGCTEFIEMNRTLLPAAWRAL